MADVVQNQRERMLDELHDLERRGLFSGAEIDMIIRRRTAFEFKLKRPSPLKEDYLAYVDYERQLDALRSLRKRAILGELARKGEKGEKGKKGKKWRKSISDGAGIRRILRIYKMAVMRFKGDLDLWFRYLEFCRERRHGRMKEALDEAIKFHPKVPGLWIYAAAWEFNQNLNVAAARALMQSGLRVCPESEDLWIEYLRMELTYLNKLKARKVALREDVKTLDRESGESKLWKEENKDLFMPLNEQGETAEGSDPQEGALEKKENFFWEQGLLTLQTIYHEAVEALPSSMRLRMRFLELLESVDLVYSDELKVEAMEDLKRDFSHDENYWDWIARLQIADTNEQKDLKREEVLSRLNRVVEVYEDALKLLPTVKMFSVYAKFWLDVIIPDREGSLHVLDNAGVDPEEFMPYILQVYEKAESSGCLTEDLACQYISFYLQTGRLVEARNLAEKLCSGKLSKATSLWVLRVSMELKWFTKKAASLRRDDLRSIFKLLREVLAGLSVSEAESLWLMAVRVFSNNEEHFEKLVKSLMTALAKYGGGEGAYSIAFAVVNSVLQKDGVQRARDMYKRFLALPHPALAFFRRCIELESNLALVGDNGGLINARKLYKSALGIYPQNRELWKDFYVMETKVGTPESANAVLSAEQETLTDAAGFSVSTDLYYSN